MPDNTRSSSFRLAPMSTSIWAMTVVLLAVPFVLLMAAGPGPNVLAVPAVLAMAVYGWIWLRFRPSEFVVDRDGIEVRWPLKRGALPRAAISSVRLIDREQLKNEIGWAIRVGAGGLWGGFGWLWTERRGVVQMYVSRADGFVWIECADERPWLITPERPEDFVAEFTS